MAENRKRKKPMPIYGPPPLKKTKLFRVDPIFVVKTGLRSIIRPEVEGFVVDWISERSILSTKISALASLLFLDKVKLAHFNNNLAFFNGKGKDVIKRCFYAVLRKNKEKEDMDPDSKELVENNGIQWPTNEYFGNQMKYMYRQYTTNVETNLKTHAKKRLTQYMKMRAWQFNVTSNGILLDTKDIDSAVSLAMRKYDNIKADDPNAADKRHKRELLLNMVVSIGCPADHDVKKFTSDHWFKSLRMWLLMQSQIDDFHIWAGDNNIKIPIIKNLKVIPVCSFNRQHIKMDTDVLYRMMCDMESQFKIELIPRVNGVRASVGDACKDPYIYWYQIFDLPKIDRILKGNKRFHKHIVSDGVAVSILYEVPARELEPLVNDGIIRKRYQEGFYIYELGIDPGMKTWNATVRRNIHSGKEVIFPVSFFQ